MLQIVIKPLSAKEEEKVKRDIEPVREKIKPSGTAENAVVIGMY